MYYIKPMDNTVAGWCLDECLSHVPCTIRYKEWNSVGGGPVYSL